MKAIQPPKHIFALWAVPVFVALGLPVLGSQLGRTRAGPESTEAYRLEQIIPVPEMPARILNQPVALTMDPFHREILALETNPPRIVAVTPDGGILRSMGEGILEAPQSLAVAYPLGQSGDRFDASNGRIFVAEPTLGRVVVFDLTGTLLKIVTADWTPAAIVSNVTPPEVHLHQSAEHTVVVADVKHGQLLKLDAMGVLLGPIDLLPNLTAGVTGRLERPQLLAELRPGVAVYDEATKLLTWWSLDGTNLGRLDLSQPVSGRSPGTVVALAHYDSGAAADVLIATQDGLWAAGIENGQPKLSVLSVPGFSLNVRAVVSQRFRGDFNAMPRYRNTQMFVISEASGELMRLVGSYDLIDAYPQYPIHRGCPMAAELPPRPWRLMVDAQQDLWVSTANGVVYRSPNGTSPLAHEFDLGYVDDLTWVNDSSVRVMGDATAITFERVGAGLVTSQDANLFSYVDCLIAGVGIRASASSVSVLDNAGPGAGSLVLKWLELLPLRPSSDRVVHDVDFRLGYYARQSPQQMPGLAAVLSPSWSARGVRFTTDVALSSDGYRGLIVDRTGGAIQVLAIDDAGNLTVMGRWPVPGRPDRASWAADGSAFVLTADGFVWHLDQQGKILSGWDAAGAMPDPRPRFVDIAVGGDDRVYLADKMGQRVLVFAPIEGSTRAPQPKVPPPCSVSSHSQADPQTVYQGQPVTATLRLTGACGRSSAKNDVLVLFQPMSEVWHTQVYQAAATGLLAGLDPTKDRVAVGLFDATGAIQADLTSDYVQIRAAVQAILGIFPTPTYNLEARPLSLARAYLETHSRPEANKIIIVLTTGGYTRNQFINGLVIDGEALRLGGIRVVVIQPSWRYSMLSAMMAYEPEDFFVAPDAATVQAVCEQLGKEFGASLLIREMTVTADLPEDMEFVEAKGATWAATRRRLTWQASRIGFQGWEATLVVKPQALGERPTFLEAHAEVEDGFGNHFGVSFPVPWITVLAPPPTPTPTPTATSTATPTASATPAPTSTPTPIPQPAFLPILLRQPPCKPQAKPVDVVLALDASNSMAGAKLSAAKAAARAFLGALASGKDRLGLVAFNSEGHVLAGLGVDGAAFERALAGIQLGAGTRMDSGIDAARTLLLTDGRPEAARAIVLLTDGRQNELPEAALSAAEAARTAGLMLYAVGLGADADLPFLNRLTADPARVRRADDEAALVAIYRALASELKCDRQAGWGGP